MTLMQEVVRISDQFLDRSNPDCIDRQGRLGSFSTLVMIAYAITAVAFVKMQEFEKTHPRVIHEFNVAFEYWAPPPDPAFKVVLPKPIDLVQPVNPETAPEPAPAAPPRVEKVTLPTMQAPVTAPQPHPTPPATRATTLSPPVSIATTNPVRLPQPQTAPLTQAPPTLPPSGAPVSGGPAASPLIPGTDPGAKTEYKAAGGPVQPVLTQSQLAGTANIAPYRKDMLVRIAQNWHPKKELKCMVLLAIAADGKLLSAEITKSTGSRKEDKAVLAAIESTTFMALPEWYKGDQLLFQIELEKTDMVLFDSQTAP